MKKFKCKQNIFDFKIDKLYEREETETGNAYRFINEKGIGHVFFKTDGNMSNIFEEVEIKEENTYNFSDLLNESVETQFEVKYKSGSSDASYIIIKKHNDDRGKYLQWDSGDEEFDDEVTVDEKIMNATFTRVEKLVNIVDFITAWKAFEEGKIIESTYTLDRYKKIDGLIKIQHQGGEFEKCGNIATTEIGNAWIIVD